MKNIAFCLYISLATLMGVHSTNVIAQSATGKFIDPIEHLAKCTSIQINGSITEGTLSEIKKMYQHNITFKEKNKGTRFSCPPMKPDVWLNSLGGDVLSAIKIGRYIREKHLNTVVIKNSECASACVLILLGGETRRVIGRVGIHRPYSVKLSSSVQDSSQSFSDINRILKEYFRDMNIPMSVLNEMNSVPPESVRWLNTQQASKMHISGTDPVWQDYKDSLEAKRLGISKATLYKRRQITNRVCAKFNDFRQRISCSLKIMKNGHL